MPTDLLSYISKLFGSAEPMAAGGPGAVKTPSEPIALKADTDTYDTRRNEWSWVWDEKPWESLKKALGPTANEIAAMPEFARPKPLKDPLHDLVFGAPPEPEPIPAGGSGAVSDLKLKLDTRNPFEDTPQLKMDTNNPFEGMSGAVAEVNRRGRERNIAQGQARLGATMQRPSSMKLSKYDTTPTLGVRG